MSECEKCHGKGTIPCSACKGKKVVPCEKCSGTGKVMCNRCTGDGEIICRWCGGSGTITEWKECPVCYHGKVIKTRWVNCPACHGEGTRLHEEVLHGGYIKREQVPCRRCDGRGQEEKTYKEICPNCHGEYSKSVEKTCSHCHGRGYFKCDTKCGKRKKKVECDKCDGAGQVPCSHCSGKGEEKCPDCERREKERQDREAAQKRREAERVERVKQAAIETERARQAEQHQAEERRDTYIGCGCLLAVIAAVAFVIWWWIEGLTIAALSEMWTKTINCVGGAGGIATLVCGLAALFFAWKMVKRMKGSAKKSTVKSTSSKKRWKFVLLGLLFGFLGVHLAYAKRWTLFLLLWAGLVTGGSFGTSDDAAKPPTDAAAQVQQTEQQKSKNSTISNVGFAVWALLWIGGTLFIKKDGKGNRM